MKKLTTVICCIMFMVAGVSVALMDKTFVPNNMMRAATVYDMSKLNVNPETFRVPLDLALDAVKNADTLKTAIQSEPEVTTADNHVVKVPVVVERKVEVPVLYIATPADNKGDPPDSSAMYSVHKLRDGGIGIKVPGSLGVEPYEELVSLAYLQLSSNLTREYVSPLKGEKLKRLGGRSQV